MSPALINSAFGAAQALSSCSVIPSFGTNLINSATSFALCGTPKTKSFCSTVKCAHREPTWSAQPFLFVQDRVGFIPCSWQHDACHGSLNPISRATCSWARRLSAPVSSSGRGSLESLVSVHCALRTSHRSWCTRPGDVRRRTKSDTTLKTNTILRHACVPACSCCHCKKKTLTCHSATTTLWCPPAISQKLLGLHCFTVLKVGSTLQATLSATQGVRITGRCPPSQKQETQACIGRLLTSWA